MARIPRILITGDPTVYHIISRTALPGFPLEDIEKWKSGTGIYCLTAPLVPGYIFSPV